MAADRLWQALGRWSWVILVTVMLGASRPILLPEGIPVAGTTLGGRVIVVDPGHGGVDGGAYHNSAAEKDIVLGVSLELGRLLTQAGARVIYTREGDYDLSGLGPDASLRERLLADLKHRAEIGNGPGVDVFLSVHANEFPSPHWHGSQVFYNARGHPDSRRLALRIQQELVRIAGYTEREINEQVEVYLMEQVRVPIVTVELGFMSNPDELRRLCDRDYQRRLAWAVFVGTAKYFAEGPIQQR